MEQPLVGSMPHTVSTVGRPRTFRLELRQSLHLLQLKFTEFGTPPEVNCCTYHLCDGFMSTIKSKVDIYRR